jgi:hypothetical protein
VLVGDIAIGIGPDLDVVGDIAIGWDLQLGEVVIGPKAVGVRRLGAVGDIGSGE